MEGLDAPHSPKSPFASLKPKELPPIMTHSTENGIQKAAVDLPGLSVGYPNNFQDMNQLPRTIC